MIVPRENKANVQYRVQDHTRDPEKHPYDVVATDSGVAFMDLPLRKQITVNHSKFFVDPKSEKLAQVPKWC